MNKELIKQLEDERKQIDIEMDEILSKLPKQNNALSEKDYKRFSELNNRYSEIHRLWYFEVYGKPFEDKPNK